MSPLPMQEGDVARFDYTLWIEGEKNPVDTSSEDEAKAHGIHREKAYRPLTVTLGRHQVIPGLESRLKDLKVGKKETLTLTPAEAYGERDAHNLKDVPMAEFRKQKVQPQVGMTLTYEGKPATILRVAGGRVRVDMNHELAGKTLRYDITLRDAITDIPAKVAAVCEYLFPMGGHKVELRDKRITLELPDQAKFDAQWPQHKFRVLTELRHAAGRDVEIVLTETYPGVPADAVAAESGAEEE
jgi:FKBP-type peptidyl-prolyl cis-trans isomerase SlyD